MKGQRISEQSEKDSRLGQGSFGEKAKGLGRVTHASGGHKPWAWTETDFGPANFDDSAESWREGARRSWGAETQAAQAWLVVGAVGCGVATLGWVGWVLWLVCGKG